MNRLASHSDPSKRPGDPPERRNAALPGAAAAAKAQVPSPAAESLAATQDLSVLSALRAPQNVGDSPIVSNLGTSTTQRKSGARLALAWLKQAYGRHLGASKNGIGSALFSLAVVTAIAPAVQSLSRSNSLLTGLGLYAASWVAYYLPFFSLEVRREREHFLGNKEKAIPGKFAAKIKEYSSLMLATEAFFMPMRTLSIAAFMHWFDFSARGANLTSFFLLNTVYMGLLPPLKHALQDLWKINKESSESGE
jgi:hypothetical protein